MITDARLNGKQVVAIDVAKDRPAWSDEPYTQRPVAYVIEAGAETHVYIDRATYDELVGMAEIDDYREGQYIAFKRPVEVAK
jgi:hypothetical protein